MAPSANIIAATHSDAQAFIADNVPLRKATTQVVLLLAAQHTDKEGLLAAPAHKEADLRHGCCTLLVVDEVLDGDQF